ncbi:hypothetical protein GCM10008023_32230 [Sphingomonas glacialis]|uniref:Uncharacterized protein n=1 Tax=Sphingomonas glacialis TaxID=658225 RepID=A0ABQ3LQA3_9SPHN|nr:hypothetical protein [Sphingomonas glacialis]GHH22326.1 hypothetical protein GCM10008023_32230 [Sphingomonas glacialis]
MRKAIMAMLAATVTLSAALPAIAQVNLRQLNQERRTDAGDRSGKLTRAESARLKAQQRSIDRLEARQRAGHGGRLTPADKRMIHDRQAEADRAITHQKHDSQRGRNHLKL